MTDNNKAVAKAVLLELANMILALYEEDTSKIVKTTPAVDEAPWEDAPAAKKATTKKAAAKPTAKKAEPEAVEAGTADDDGTDWDARTAEVSKWSLAKIKKHLVTHMEFDPEDLVGVSKEDLVADLIETERDFSDTIQSGDDDTADDVSDDDIVDEDTEDDADDEEELTREEAMQYTLTELRGIAKDSGFTAADLKGLDKDGIIDLIFDAEDDDDAEADEDVLSSDDLEGMSLAELKALCRDNGITVKRGSSHEDLIEALVEADVVAA